MTGHLNHIGISVRSLERSIEFYTDLANMSLVVQGEFEGAEYERVLGLAGARGKVALLRAPGLQLELFEFYHPQPRTKAADQPVSDHGISHFCLELDDIETEYRRLLAKGVVFHCPPVRFPRTGNTAAYGRDPDGNVFELLQRATILPLQVP